MPIIRFIGAFRLQAISNVFFSQRFQARTFVPLKPCRVHTFWGSCHLKPFGHYAFHSISWFMTFEAHLAMKAFEGF
jgi:hypothetical protein